MILMPSKTDFSKHPAEVTVVPAPNKDLLVWEAPARPFKKRDREYFTTIAAIVFLLVVILLFIKEWLLIGVIIALMFFSYALATVPPPKVAYKITTRGISIDDKNYRWQQCSRWWFSEQWGNPILNIETYLTFPRKLQLMTGSMKEEILRQIMDKYLVMDKPKKSSVDKISAWLQEKVPLEAK